MKPIYMEENHGKYAKANTDTLDHASQDLSPSPSHTDNPLLSNIKQFDKN